MPAASVTPFQPTPGKTANNATKAVTTGSAMRPKRMSAQGASHIDNIAPSDEISMTTPKCPSDNPALPLMSGTKAAKAPQKRPIAMKAAAGPRLICRSFIMNPTCHGETSPSSG